MEKVLLSEIDWHIMGLPFNKAVCNALENTLEEYHVKNRYRIANGYGNNTICFNYSSGKWQVVNIENEKMSVCASAENAYHAGLAMIRTLVPKKEKKAARIFTEYCAAYDPSVKKYLGGVRRGVIKELSDLMFSGDISSDVVLKHSYVMGIENLTDFIKYIFENDMMPEKEVVNVFSEKGYTAALTDMEEQAVYSAFDSVCKTYFTFLCINAFSDERICFNKGMTRWIISLYQKGRNVLAVQYDDLIEACYAYLTALSKAEPGNAEYAKRAFSKKLMALSTTSHNNSESSNSEKQDF